MSATTAKPSTPGCRQLEPSNASKPSTPALALSVEQAAAALSIGWDAFHEHVEPELRIVRLGRRKLIPVSELEKWLADHAENVLEGR
jgi:hypothetical protein